jgi:uncharacterized protein YciI
VPTFLVDRSPGADWVHGIDTREQRLWDEHAAFMDDVYERGHVVLAGPIMGGAGEAVLVMEAGSEESIRELFADDPWCRDADILGVGRIREWRLFFDARGS